ncbi:MAG: bis(5'-nucleosyl)-tetraphosphatase (symmetrical) YqeK [Peptoniphilaceae bacterium]
MGKNKDKLIELIGEKRYQHVLRVQDTAIKLAEVHNVDETKASIAAYYHDCAKIKDYDLLYKTCKEYDLKLSYDMKKAPQIIHSYLGAIIAETDYGIEDHDILNAIRYHTTGRENMSKLEKIIFLSDYIEPMRNFNGIDKIRQVANEDLDEAMYLSLNNTIIYLIKKDSYIAKDTILARNYVMERRK